MLRLKVQPSDGEPYWVAVERLPMKVGRSARSDLRLEDPFASRLHAELRRVGDELRLSDLGSGNGTLVNGRRIGSDMLIAAGDEIQIGNTVLSLITPDEAPPEGDGPDGTAAAGGRGRSRRPGSGERSTMKQIGGELVGRPRETRRDPRTGSIGPGQYTEVIAAVREQLHETAEREAVAAHPDPMLLAEVLAKLGTALLSPASLSEVLNQILDLIFEGVAAERAYLLLDEDGELVCRVASYREAEGGAGSEAGGGNLDLADCRISHSIVDEVVGRAAPVLTSDAQEDERFRHRHSVVMGKLRSVMAAPLLLDGKVLGMIYVDSPLVAGAFTELDLQMLVTLAGVSAIKLQNAWLVEEWLATERLRGELSKAREIQSRLLPTGAPQLPGYELVGMNFPHGEVGGDYYDYLPLDDDSADRTADGGIDTGEAHAAAPRRLLIALGDVSGKGLDAALLMSSLHAVMRAGVSAGARGGELLARANRYLVDCSPSNRFVTLAAVELDLQEHQLRYVNAGHNPPLLLRADGELALLDMAGMPLGIQRSTVYRAVELEIAPGDVLVLFSDGISEATNRDGVELTEVPLQEVVRRHPDDGARQLLERIDEELGCFLDGAPQGDDMTLVILRRSPAGG